jgi:hypothetical protein
MSELSHTGPPDEAGSLSSRITNGDRSIAAKTNERLLRGSACPSSSLSTTLLPGLPSGKGEGREAKGPTNGVEADLGIGTIPYTVRAV